MRCLVILVQDIDDERGRAGEGAGHAPVDGDDLEGVLALAVVVQLAEERDLSGFGVDDEIVVTSFLDSVCKLKRPEDTLNNWSETLRFIVNQYFHAKARSILNIIEIFNC